MLLQKCSSELQERLVKATDSNIIWAMPRDSRGWAKPALRPNQTFGSIDTNELSKVLYSSPKKLGRLQSEVWDQAVDALMLDRKSVTGVASSYFPAISFFGTRSCLVQLLYALSWSSPDADMTISLRDARLKVLNSHITIDHRTVTHRGVRRRLPESATVDPRIVLSLHMGSIRRGLFSTAAVYRHLAGIFPLKLRAIDTIFACAVTAGREFEAVLTSMFDVRMAEESQDRDRVWVEARRIVRSSVVNPNLALWALLQSTMTLQSFTEVFGTPWSGLGKRYSHRQRTKHHDAISQVENDVVNRVVTGNGTRTKAARALMKFQNMMGTPV